MKISFDFDGCLNDNKFIQMMCKLFLSSGHEIFILTSRDSQLSNKDLFKKADELNIKKENIIMTNGSLKVHAFMFHQIDLHFDNSYEEVAVINDEFQKGPNKFEKNESMPAILVNLDTEELGFIHNFIRRS